MAARKASSSALVAFGDEFDAAVGQVADGAGDFKTGGDGLGGVAEPDALHAAGIKNIHAAAVGNGRGGWRLNRHGRMKPKSGGVGAMFFAAGRTIILFFL